MSSSGAFDVPKHRRVLANVVGIRIPLLDRLGVTEGWVVTAEVPEGFWDKCNTCAIPLQAVDSPATEEYAKWVEEYGEGVIAVLIQDEESEGGFSGGPMLVADLDRGAAELLDESLLLIGKDIVLSAAKRRCAMLLLGWIDTK